MGWTCIAETHTPLLDLHRGDARRASLQEIPFSIEEYFVDMFIDTEYTTLLQGNGGAVYKE
ncbi:MAG: hypothetical protein LIP08_08295 [Bacteroides sp.]|nr:hypothetical protein [Bacteroides sp.]